MQTINHDVFNALKEMMMDIIGELVNVFIEDSYKLLEEIEAGINTQDTALIVKAAHTLKSSAKNMGADKLAHYSLEIEESIEANIDFNVLTRIANKAKDEMNEVRKIFQKCVRN